MENIKKSIESDSKEATKSEIINKAEFLEKNALPSSKRNKSNNHKSEVATTSSAAYHLRSRKSLQEKEALVKDEANEKRSADVLPPFKRTKISKLNPKNKEKNCSTTSSLEKEKSLQNNKEPVTERHKLTKDTLLKEGAASSISDGEKHVEQNNLSEMKGNTGSNFASEDSETLSEDKKDKKQNVVDYKSRRFFKRIPIFVVEYHNDVMEFIYRCLGSRHLPFENNTLLHFDAHADMVISRDIPASVCFDKDFMLQEISIENWIMHPCFAGNFNRLIWVKNSWCGQMPVGKYKFKIGEKNDIIHVTSTLSYFVSEGNFCEIANMRQVRDLELQVVNADTEQRPNPKEILSVRKDPTYILDIDLDFFSTANPFLEIYRETNCYEQLADIFDYTLEENVEETAKKRVHQLKALKDIFEYLHEKRSLEGIIRPPLDIIPEVVFEKIENLIESVKLKFEDDRIDWLFIFDSGNTTDNDGLPHHITTETELNLYYDQFKEFLKNLPHDPVVITISRSTVDGYCPSHQISFIQKKVLEIIYEVFGDKLHAKPILHYKDESWDVMEL